MPPKILLETTQQLDFLTPVFNNSGLGKVVSVEDKVYGIAPGDRVVWIGAPFSSRVSVPNILCGRVPDKVSDEQALWTGLGAYLLRALRQSRLQLGEIALVSCLPEVSGLLHQLLELSGCQHPEVPVSKNVPGTKLRLPASQPQVRPYPVWADALFTDQPPSTQNRCWDMLRRGAKIIMLGSQNEPLPMECLREKDLTIRAVGLPQIQAGYCFPPGYSRWTPQKNLELFLGLVRSGKISL